MKSSTVRTYGAAGARPGTRPAMTAPGAVGLCARGRGFSGRAARLDPVGGVGRTRRPGRWLTVYANAGQAPMPEIAGACARDTVGDAQGTGPRWHLDPRLFRPLRGTTCRRLLDRLSAY